MSRRSPPLDTLHRLLSAAAGRLMLRHPHDALRRLAERLMPDGPATDLTCALREEDDALFEELGVDEAALGRLARACGLSSFDLDVLGLALLPCLDDRAGSALVELTGSRRMSVGLALRLIPGDDTGPEATAARRALREGPLWRFGLLRLDDARLPLPERILEPDAALLAGLDGTWPEALAGDWTPRRPPAVSTAASLQSTVDALVERLEADTAEVVHIAGPIERGETALAAAAAALSREVVIFDAPAAGGATPPWREAALIARATGAIVGLATSAAEMAGAVGGLAGPVLLLAPERSFLRTRSGGPPARRIPVGATDPLEQAEAWRVALSLQGADADQYANQTWMSPADIVAIAARVGEDLPLNEARLAHAPPRPVQGAIVRTPRPLWSRLVLDPETSDRLDDVVRRYRHRVTVRNRWGLDSGGRGLVVMLTGDSGVGKTMAAEAVAARLGLPIMVADLSLIVSKYIGETERNLSELFEAAEGFAAVVFFDEADALFGKRTAVEDAHDRYANIEINFLLQRLEAFEGIALLATNLAQGVDTAFHRRFDLVVDIPRPAAGERLKLWRGHLPKDRFDKALDLGFIAERFELTGGEIRNAALAAAYRAAERDACVSAAMLRDAIAEEFAKKGRPMPAWPEAGDV